jgi:membrane associated rhomboid family serine protease
MLMPIGDDNSAIRIRPYVNYALIAANVLVWIAFQGMGANTGFTDNYSTVPAQILAGQGYFTLLTSTFMHGGWGHLLGNMLYLFIFGDNIENKMGSKRYLVFYLLCGLIASLSHVFFSKMIQQDLMIPSLGASGAISGVLGAYILLFPKLRVKTLVFYTIMEVPAYISLGIWIGFQVISGLGMLGGNGGGGVAYAAHIGGFIAGLLLVKLFIPKIPDDNARLL